MAELTELKQAVALLACAMATGDVLSGCNKSSAQPAPTVTPEPTTPAANDVEALRRAAAVVSEWQRRDPAQTASMLREHGIFACDETTAACIAAKQSFDHPPPPPPSQAELEAQRQREAAAAAAAAVAAANQPAVRIPTRHPAVRHPNDDRVPVA